MKTVFEAIVPGWKGEGLPIEFPLYVRIFLRSSILLAHLYSVKRHAVPLGWISYDKRVAIIESLYNHPNSTVRGIAQFWKLTALMTQTE
ncbi:MAG: hypothetical protein U0V74_14950 [Chitinophagales bacterium]